MNLMEWKNCNSNYTTEYILPFLFNDKTFFNKEYGFVNAYVNDINRPYLEDKIIILFRYIAKKYLEIKEAMKLNPYLYDIKEVHIDGELFDEYIFTIPPTHKTTIKEIINGNSYAITYQNKGKILAFWNNVTSDKMLELLKSIDEIDICKTQSLNALKEWVPEEDYIDFTNNLFTFL